MEKELTDLFETVKRAADDVNSSGEEERCLDVLKWLEKFPVNYQVLVSTQVDKRLHQLISKHSRDKILSAEIKTAASDVLDMWKGILVKETTKAKKNGSVGKAESADTETTTNNAKRSSSSIKSDQNSAPKNVYLEDPTRNKVRKIFLQALRKVPLEVDEHLKELVKKKDPRLVSMMVEMAMFKEWGKSTGPQKSNYHSVIFNIKDPMNPDFRRKVLIGKIKPREVPKLTPKEMASDALLLEITYYQMQDECIYADEC